MRHQCQTSCHWSLHRSHGTGRLSPPAGDHLTASGRSHQRRPAPQLTLPPAHRHYAIRRLSTNRGTTILLVPPVLRSTCLLTTAQLQPHSGSITSGISTSRLSLSSLQSSQPTASITSGICSCLLVLVSRLTVSGSVLLLCLTVINYPTVASCLTHCKAVKGH